MTHVRIETPAGWSDKRPALVDSGSPYCLIPRSVWSAAKYRVFSRGDLRSTGIGSGTSLCRFGEVTLVIDDDVASSPPLRIRGLLLNDDSDPLLLGFEGFLTHAVLYCNYPEGSAYLEFPQAE